MTNFDQLRFFATISIVAFLWAWLMGQQEPRIMAPPLESTRVVQLTVISDPPAKLRNNLIEAQARTTDGEVAWWYFANEGALRSTLKKGSKLSIWISTSDEKEHGGQGYIWQVKDIDSNDILLSPDQVIFHRTAKNNYAKFIRYLLLSVSIITASIAFVAFKRHKAQAMTS